MSRESTPKAGRTIHTKPCLQVDPGNIQAKVEDGVLKVIVPKTEKHEQQGTEVNVS